MSRSISSVRATTSPARDMDSISLADLSVIICYRPMAARTRDAIVSIGPIAGTRRTIPFAS